MPTRDEFVTYNYALVICRNPKTGKYLAINETKNRGWWIPAGGVDSGETFRDGAKRKCIEEAGVQINLLGIIKIEYIMGNDDLGKMRVVFYAEPVDPDCVPKEF